MPVQTTIQMRRDTAANWTSTNPILASGEWGLETDTRLMKIGNGTTAWNSLAYQLRPLLDEVIATDPTGAWFYGSGYVTYGASSNYLSTPDSAALSITGDIDIRAKVSLVNWAIAGNLILGKSGTGSSKSYAFDVGSDGKLYLSWWADGATRIQKGSTVATGFANGATKWIRATLDVDNGAGGNDVNFYTSDDGTTWTQLGNTVTTAGTTSIFDGTDQLTIGTYGALTTVVNGTYYKVQILNGIGGTTVFDADFSAVPADSFAFTESSSNAATVTLTTTKYSFGLPGTTLTGTTTFNYGSNTTSYMPFTVGNKSITIKHLAFEQTTTTANTTRWAIYAADAQNQPTGAPLFNSGAISVAGAAAIYRIRITPLTLLRGNYLLAYNSNAGQTLRVWTGSSAITAPNILGANLNTIYFVVQTLSGDFPSTPVKWTGRQAANGPYRFNAVLGWS